MARITYKEHRGDRYLNLSARVDGKRAGYSITIGWAPNNDGGLFSRNVNAATVRVTVTKDGAPQDVVLFAAEAGRAKYQSEAYKMGRAFVREHKLKALIERDLTATL